MSRGEQGRGVVRILGMVLLTTTVGWCLAAKSTDAQSRVIQKWVHRLDGPVDGPDSTATFEGGPNEFGVGKAIVADAQGNVIVAGNDCVTVSSPGNCTRTDLQIEKYSPSGERLWGGSLHAPGNYAIATAVATDASGNVYVTGWEALSTTAQIVAFVTIKYSSAGIRQWIATYQDNSQDAQTTGSGGIVVDAQGNSYISGYITTDTVGFKGAIETVKYSSSGQQLWALPYSQDHNNVTTGMAIDANDNLYVTGWSTDGGAFEQRGFTLKYSTSGARLWVQTTDNLDEPLAGNNAIVLDAAWNVYVLGTASPIPPSTETESQTSEAYVEKYTPSGTLAWSSTKQGVGSQAIGLGSSGDIYITGPQTVSLGATSAIENFSTSKLNSSGTFEWTKTYNGTGSGNDEPFVLAVNLEGDVYVTGQSSSSSEGFDYATVKYDSSGDQLWVARYNGPGNGNDLPAGIAMSGGNLYVTGTSVGSDGQAGWATLDYVQDAAVPSPSSLTFAAQKEGTTSAAQSVTLKNSSTVEDLVIEDIDAKGPFAQTNNCAKSLVPGGSCTIKIIFTPTATGTQTGSVLICDQWAGSPAVITLTGAGTN